MKKKIALAFSGGLDTSFCIPYLIEKYNCEIHAITVNTGGFSDVEIEALEKKALTLGAHAYHHVNAEKVFYENGIKFLVFGNALRNDNYPLSVSSERIFQAIEVAKYAKKIGAEGIAHGSTGAGNDQVRFDLVFSSMVPEMDIITPIRDQEFKRAEEVDFLKSKGFDWSESQKSYSINKGLWGTSIGGKETLGSELPIPDEAFPSQPSQSQPRDLTLTFTKGELTAIDHIEGDPVSLIKQLTVIGNAYAIGRDIHVGDTIIGIKGRVAFEAPAPIMIIAAHKLLEKHCLTKWQMHWKKQLGDWYGMFMHEGQFLDPVMRDIEHFLTHSQRNVSGDVVLRLYPYRYQLCGIKSPHDLMDSEYGKYGEEQGGWTPEEAKGFIKLFGNAQNIYHHKNIEQ